jgi:hypothetical protein
MRYVGEPIDVPRDKAAWFVDALRRYHIDSVVLSKDAVRNARTKSLLRVADLVKVGVVDWDFIYSRTSTATHAQNDVIAALLCRTVQKSQTVLAPFGVASALDERACVGNLSSPRCLTHEPPDRAEEILDLERLTYVEADLARGQRRWLRDALDRHAVSIVVLRPAPARNLELRAALNELGFRKLRAVEGHTLYQRTLPAGG